MFVVLHARSFGPKGPQDDALLWKVRRCQQRLYRNAGGLWPAVHGPKPRAHTL